MTGIEVTIISGLVSLVTLLVGVVTGKRMGNSNSNGLTSEEKNKLNELYDMHNSRDENGVLRWWVPKSIPKNIEAMRNEMREQHYKNLQFKEKLIDNQRDIVETLSAIKEELEKE